MAVTVTGTGVRNSADATTGWSTGALQTEGQIQGSGYIGQKTGAGITRYNHLGTPTLDFTPTTGAQAGEHVVVWYLVLTFPLIDTDANGGIRGYVGNDAGTNFEEQTISSVGYSGGWRSAVFNPQVNIGGGDFSGGSYDDSAADAFGITYNMTAGIMGNFVNAGVDQITIGFGVQVTGATQSFSDILTAESTNVWGWVTEFEGVIYPQGKIEIGDGTTTTTFTDTSQTIVYRDQPVLSDFYEFLVDTDATCTLGAITGGVTSAGCFFTSAGTAQYALTVTEGGTVEAVLNAYATTFSNFRIASLNPSTTMQDTTFTSGGQITLNGATLTGCSILSSTVGADTGALLVDSQSEWDGGGTRVVQDCFFGDNAANANSGAIEITATGTYEFENLTFSGNNFDVINSSGGAVTINVTGGDTPTVRNLTTSTTVVNVAAPITVEGVTEGTSVLLLANETVGTVTIGDVLTQQFADTNGEINYNLPYESAFDPSGLDILVKARNQGIAVAAIAEDGGVFTDQTAEASSNSTADMTLLPTGGAAVNDAYYFAHNEEFSRLKLDISTAFAGTSLTIVWEYWNGSAWTALSGVSDGTNGLLNTGPNIVSWTIPGDWTTTLVNSQGPLYYVRYRVTAVSGQTTDPLGRKCALDVTRYLPYRRARTVTATGITDVASWQQDAVSQF